LIKQVELQTKDLRHDHINWFVGACIDYPNYCVVTEYCPKGSLADLLSLDGYRIGKMMLTSLVRPCTAALKHYYSML
jgi:serine/threonine protein kinase